MSNGVVKAVRCKAEIDAGVETEFIGAAEEEADARLKKADKPSEGGGPYAKTAGRPENTHAESVQPAEAAPRRLEPAEETEYVVGELRRRWRRLGLGVVLRRGTRLWITGGLRRK